MFNWELHVACKMIYLAHASELSDHSETLHKHFDEVGTPAMMGVGDYAYTMVGVCTDRKTGKIPLTSFSGLVPIQISSGIPLLISICVAPYLSIYLSIYLALSMHLSVYRSRQYVLPGVILTHRETLFSLVSPCRFVF